MFAAVSFNEFGTCSLIYHRIHFGWRHHNVISYFLWFIHMLNLFIDVVFWLINYLWHCRYLSALISQSFLDIGSVSRILDSIMKLCLQFCWSIEQYETHPNTTEFDHITEVLYQQFHQRSETCQSYVFLGKPYLPWYDEMQEFNKKSNSLYTILRSSRLAGSQRAPFLRQFLMRLNFNSFFEVRSVLLVRSIGIISIPTFLRF
jgi:hypothetical protein